MIENTTPETLSGTYLLADIPVHIQSLYDEVHTLCAPYRTGKEPLFTIRTTAEDIENEGVRSDNNRKHEGLPEYHFPAPYLETLAVYRQIATRFIEQNVLLMHGSVIAVDGEGYMFTALSGTGKSTHVRLWRELFGPRAVMVNDDKPLVRIPSDGSPIIYGTPWDGKHHLSNNISVPLKAIVILDRAEQNSIRPISITEAFPTLLQQTYRPEQPQLMAMVLQLLSQLSQHTGLYHLYCNMNPEAAQIAYEGIV